MQEPYQNIDELLHEDSSNVDADAQAFYKLLEDAKQELYLECRNFSRLAFLVQHFHIKCLCGWSNKSFNMLLDYQRTSIRLRRSFQIWDLVMT